MKPLIKGPLACFRQAKGNFAKRVLLLGAASSEIGV